MKLLNFLFLTLFTLLIVNHSKAQDEFYPWHISAGVNIMDYFPFNPKTEYTSENELDERIDHFNYGVPTISISKYIEDGFSFGVSGSMSEIDNYDGVEFMKPLDYLTVDGFVKYDINYLIGKTGFLDPYATFGGGYFMVDDHGTGTLNGGLGLNLWFTNKVGINLDSKYKHSFETLRAEINQHFLHSAGLVYRFGASDRDGDGVANNKDDCPKVYGLMSLNGCPDMDEDQVPDIRDACPEIPGVVELNGCPDKDGDGIPDKDDKCPDDAGVIKQDGCPDEDGDGVIDSKDKCPQSSGPEENNGCPYADSDNDGVLDKDDICINEPGPASNKGCPKLISSQEVVMLEDLFRTVYFEIGKDTFTPETLIILNDASNMLRKYIYSSFVIEGHTDNTGYWKTNQELSERRANAIKNYFISKGVSDKNLKAIGYGETKPIATNRTLAGRAKNRRVEIKVSIDDIIK